MPPDNVKAAQEAEAFQRSQQRGTANPEGTTPQAPDNTVPDDLPRAAAPAPVATPEPEPQRPTLRKDSARDAIAARFRQNRDTNDADARSDVEELRAFAHNGVPPELVAPQQHGIDADKIAAHGDEADVIDPDLPAAAATQDPDAPQAAVPVVRRKLIVRGQTLELTDEEMEAAAQRGLAGDSYMDEARRTLDEAKALRRDFSAAPGSQQQNTPAATSGQPAEPSATPSADEQPDHELVQVIEQVQFGDPTQAAKALNDVINRRVTAASSTHSQQATQVAMQNERIRDEAERSQRFLQDFERDNPELASDEFASAAMEKHLYRLQREDILKLVRAYGKDETQVPSDPKTIANWHLFYRTRGHDVRDVPGLLKTARDNFIAWRGTPSSPQPAPRPGAPAAPTQQRVVVNRDARRQAIPQQPTRTVTPRSDSQAQSPQPRDRSAIVRDMIKTRSAPRRIIGVG